MGPFSEPLLPNLRISTLGFIPKKAQSEFRMIHQLSFLFGALVNDFIRKSFVQYTLLRLIKRLGRGCTLAKTDVRSALVLALVLVGYFHKFEISACRPGS